MLHSSVQVLLQLPVTQRKGKQPQRHLTSGVLCTSLKDCLTSNAIENVIALLLSSAVYNKPTKRDKPVWIIQYVNKPGSQEKLGAGRVGTVAQRGTSPHLKAASAHPGLLTVLHNKTRIIPKPTEK